MSDNSEENIENIETDAADKVVSEASETEAVTEVLPIDETVDLGAADLDSPEETVPEAAFEDSVEDEVSDEVTPETSEPATKTVAAASSSGGLSNMVKGLIVLIVIFAVGGGLVFWKAKYGSHATLTSISAQEMEILLKDANPMMLKRLKDDPELRTQQADNLKQLLAVASQARKEGLDTETNLKLELENIRAEVIASNYDQEINKDKGPMPPFGFIGEEQVTAFWGNPEAESGGISWIWGGSEARRRQVEFDKFLKSKLDLMKEQNPSMPDREPSEEELKQARDYFAKVNIYADEAEAKMRSGELGDDFKKKVELQVKLQQANLLARTYAQKVLAERTKVTDEDVQKYIAEHPELNPAEKKTKAEDILKRAKAGEDFAKLANEFSEDPGNKDPKGELLGGLYKDVTKGRMMPAFEEAALALEPGQIAENLVETPYGFHIIKLEKKSETKDESGQTTPTYDVRHILISTAVKDSENPMAREMPVDQMVRAKLEEEKQKSVLDEIVANNPVEVATDYTVPEVSDEELQKMMQQQQMPQQPQAPAPDGEDAPNQPEPQKPEPKAKGK